MPFMKQTSMGALAPSTMIMVGFATACTLMGIAGKFFQITIERDASLGPLSIAVFGGVAAAFAILCAILWQKVTLLSRQQARQSLLAASVQGTRDDLNALLATDASCCLAFSEGSARLVANTLPAALSVPSKAALIPRFQAWLQPEDASRLENLLEQLQTTGEGFQIEVMTHDNAILEAIGAVCGSEAVLRFRAFSPASKQLLTLLRETKRLQHALKSRDMLADSLPHPIWFRDAGGKLTWVNRAYLDAAGSREREEAVQGQIELFETRHRESLLRQERGGKPARLKVQTVVNGSIRVYEAITVASDRGSAGAALDMAPLLVAQEELGRQTIAHLRTLDKVSTGIAVFGSDRKLVYSNGALAQVFDLGEKAAKGSPSVSDFFDMLRQKRLLPDQIHYRKWRDERISGWPLNKYRDELWHRSDGRTIHVAVDCREDGGLTFLFDDVTAKLSLERQYHALIQSQRETLDHLTESIAVFGGGGRLTFCNSAFRTLFDLPSEDPETRPHFRDIVAECRRLIFDEELWVTVAEAVTGTLEGGDALSGMAAASNGRSFAYAVTPLPDGGTLLTFADITDRKRVEEVLIERNEALEASDRLKTAFLSHVSYELRTPLTTVIGFTDLLGTEAPGPLSNRQKDYLKDIRTSSLTLLSIINDVIDLAVIDAGQMDVRLEPIKVEDVIEAATLGIRDRLARTNVTLDVRIQPDAGTAIADANRLTQVLYNLMSNALGFSPDNATITLSVGKIAGGITISIQDQGLGIPEDEQSSVFERFRSKSKGSRHRGAGLGLSLVKSIIELHRGGVDLRSTPGAGTTVTIFLPDEHPHLSSAASS